MKSHLTYLTASLIGFVSLAPASFAKCSPGQIAHLTGGVANCVYTDGPQAPVPTTMQIISGPGRDSLGRDFYRVVAVGYNSNSLFYSNGSPSVFMVDAKGSCQIAPPPPPPREIELSVNYGSLDCQ